MSNSERLLVNPVPQQATRPRRFRVAMIVTGFPHEGNPGVGIFNLRAAQALSTLSDVVVVYLRTWLPGRKLSQISVHDGLPIRTMALPQSPIAPALNLAIYSRWGWSAVASALHGCDLIHSVGMDFAGVVASAWAKRAGMIHVVQVIGSDLNAHNRRMASFARSSAWIHAVACDSDALAKEFRQRYPEFRNVHRIWRGVDLAAFQPAGASRWPHWGCGIKFLYMGGLPSNRKLPYKQNTKGGQTLMSSWASAEDVLAEAGAHLLLANIAANETTVEKWRATLRFPQNVTVMGQLDPKLVAAYLRGADVVLIPSLQEGLPNVAMEAAACGRPVLASNVGGLPEVISHGQTGLLLPPGDEPQWKQALISCATRTLDLPALGKNARRRMQELFDSSNYPGQMIELYKTALCEATGSRS
jgi:glycosyltransferase involved in cell wall biosynthesis